MVRYGQMVAKRSLSRSQGRRIPSAHIATGEVNGGVRTACGLFLAVGAHRTAGDDHPPCDKCALHATTTPERKRFVRGSYPTSH